MLDLKEGMVEKEIEGVNIINKDLLVFNKDLSMVLKQISQGKQELVNIERLKEQSYEELKKIREKEQPLIDSLNKTIDEKSNELHNLNVQIDAAKLSLKTIRDDFKLMSDDFNRGRSKWENLISDLKTQSIQFDNDIKNKIDTIGKYSRELELKADECKKLNEVVDEIEKQKKNLESINKELSDNLIKIKNLKSVEDRITNDAIDFDKRIDEFNKLYAEVRLIHRRLTRKYIKIFKQYANI